MSAELNVTLRLILDKLQADTKRAAAVIQKNLGVLQVKEETNAIRAKNSEIQKSMKFWNEGIRNHARYLKQLQAEANIKVTNIGGQRSRRGNRNPLDKGNLTNVGGALATPIPNLNIEEDAARAADQKERRIRREADLSRIMDAKKADSLRREQDKLKFGKDMSLLMLPLLKPGSVWGAAFASRAVSSGLLGTETGRNAMGKFGLSGAKGAAIATTALIAAAQAAGAALKVLAYVVKDLTIKAIENARKLYAKSLTTGLGIGFVQQRSSLAQIMGVSEEQVYMFGNQVRFLSSKIEYANSVISKTVLPLTTVSWNFKILELDIEALGAAIGNDLSPALNGLLVGLQALAGWFTKIADSKIIQMAWIASMVAQASGIPNILGSLAMLGASGGQASLPQSWMKPLAADHLGRMGLVMGMGVNTPQQQTAKNTAATAKTLVNIYNRMSKQGQDPQVFTVGQSYL